MRELSEAEAGLLVPLMVIGFIILFFSLLFAYERWSARRRPMQQDTGNDDESPPRE